MNPTLWAPACCTGQFQAYAQVSAFLQGVLSELRGIVKRLTLVVSRLGAAVRER